jgi:hypothetical protein
MKKSRQAVVARKGREIALPGWLNSDRKEFVQAARKLVSARGKAARVQILREGLAERFATRLLGEAPQDDPEVQVECWRLASQLWAYDAWRHPLRHAAAESSPPSPLNFSNAMLAPLVEALLGLYGKEALTWCVYAYLISSRQAAKRTEQAIVAGAFAGKAVIEAIGDSLKEIQAEPEPLPRGLPAKIARLLSQSLTKVSGRSKSAAPKAGSLTLSGDQAAALIHALLSTKPADDAPKGSDNLENALAETAWVEADEALARALQHTPALNAVIHEPALESRLRDELGEIVQAVRASAAKRVLEIEGDPGSEVEFNPSKHAQDDPRVRSAKRVRIITPTVYQGRGANRHVLRVADVEPV